MAGLVQNHKLAKHLSDASFSEIVRQLSYKQHLFGSPIQFSSRFFPSSKMCSSCGWINQNQTLSDRTFACLDCGSIIDRDLNAASNIRNEAIQLVAGSGYIGVSPVDILARAGE